MFSKKQESGKIDREQRELIEYAQARVRQKKNLFRHFIVFLAAAVVFIILNLVLDLGKDFRPMNIDWFVWAIMIWFFILLVHTLNVFLVNSFMDKKWEHEQIDKLVARQNKRIDQLKQREEKKQYEPENKPESNPRIGPDKPFNL